MIEGEACACEIVDDDVRRDDIQEAAIDPRHGPGADVILFGTGDAAHLRTNIASLLKPPLPEADRAKLTALFARLEGVGLDGHQGRTR